MDGLEKIAEQIRAQAQQSADETIADARRRAEELRAQTEAEDAEAARQMNEQAQRDAKAECARAQSAAEAEGRRALLAEKQKLIAQAIAEAHRRLTALPDDEYFALLAKLAGENCLPQPGELLLSPKDLARMPAGFPAQVQAAAQQKGGALTVAAQTRAIDGGFVLVYGGIEENCSFEALLAAQSEQLQDVVHRALFS